jgi:hypothetical protein
MQVCNISFQVEPATEMQWLEWMKTVFIPSMMDLNCFGEYKFYSLEVDATQAPTYTLQLFCNSKETMELYRLQHAATQISQLHTTWGEQYFHFSSYMQIVN